MVIGRLTEKSTQNELVSMILLRATSCVLARGQSYRAAPRGRIMEGVCSCLPSRQPVLPHRCQGLYSGRHTCKFWKHTLYLRRKPEVTTQITKEGTKECSSGKSTGQTSERKNVRYRPESKSTLGYVYSSRPCSTKEEAFCGHDQCASSLWRQGHAKDMQQVFDGIP